MNEIELVSNILKGDKYSFDILVEPYITQAHKTSYLILGDFKLSEDAVQESLLQTYLSIDKFDPEIASFKTWFNSIVVNTSLKISRKKLFTLEFKEKHYNVSGESSEDVCLNQEEHEIIFECVQKLKIKLRTVVVLHYFQDLSVKEIADTLNVKEGTVKSRLYKARIKLEEILKEKGDSISLLGGVPSWKNK